MTNPGCPSGRAPRPTHLTRGAFVLAPGGRWDQWGALLFEEKDRLWRSSVRC